MPNTEQSEPTAPDAPDDRAARASGLDDALAANQRLEREEREYDLEKQRRADERFVQALADRPEDDPGN